MKELNFEAGQKVVYIPRHANGNISHKDVEYGIVSSVSENGNVFVKYVKNGIPQSTAQLTPKHLLKHDF